jgi:ferredoxin
MSTNYTVEILYKGKSYSVEVPEDRKVLEVALEQGIDIPSSCTAGVCTTCAAKLLEGTVDQSEGMGLSPELQKDGYALLCVSYPRSNLKVEAGMEEMVYERQFGMTS